MKIVTLAQFLELPAGTLFHKYEPQVFGPLEVFEGPTTIRSTSADFVAEPVSEPSFEGVENSGDLGELLYEMERTGKSASVCYGEMATRDGLYDENQLYAVYEKPDVARLIRFLQEQYKRLPE